MQDIVSKMNTELAIHVVFGLNENWLHKVWWLNRVADTPFMVQLSLAFVPALYCPKEAILEHHRLHVIQRGLCIHGRSILSKDDVWGVDFLLSQAHLRVNKLTLAISHLLVQYLTRDALEETMLPFPREADTVRRAYRILCLLRGVIWHTGKVKAQDASKSKSRATREEEIFAAARVSASADA